MPAGVLAAVLALAAVTGCSAGEAPRGAEPSSSPPASERPASAQSTAPKELPRTATPAPSAGTPTRDPLAELAESIEVDEQLVGGDISWPQCPPGMGIPQKRSQGSPLPRDDARYVVIGLTNGPGMYPNPCLSDQVAYAKGRRLPTSAYAVASYPEPADLARYAGDGPFDGDTGLEALANTGYQQALFNVRSMRDAGLPSPFVWIDVEPVPDFAWSSDRVANAAVVRGLARGYEDSGLAVGVYSTPYLWTDVVGDLELGVPEWRAAGHTSVDEALARCAEDRAIQGGVAVLGQWVEDNRDRNVTCPGASVDLARYFHRF